MVLEYVRSVPLHRWLFGLSIILAIAAPPHAIIVYGQHLPTALLNLHLFTVAVLVPFAELRRQWSVHTRGSDKLTRLVSSGRR